MGFEDSTPYPITGTTTNGGSTLSKPNFLEDKNNESQEKKNTSIVGYRIWNSINLREEQSE